MGAPFVSFFHVHFQAASRLSKAFNKRKKLHIVSMRYLLESRQKLIYSKITTFASISSFEAFLRNLICQGPSIFSPFMRRLA